MTKPHRTVAESGAAPQPPIPRPHRLTRLALDYGLPLLLLAISAVTTTAIGARFMHNFLLGRPAISTDSDLWPWPWLFAHPSRFSLGWPFSATLLAILLIHEFAHYIACRAHGIRATLPWVLPAPTLSGTAGAVIQIRTPIPSRRALVDVGASGPLAGYLASLAAAAVGLSLSRPTSPAPPPTLIVFGQPLTLKFLPALLSPLHLPAFNHAARHPILIAAWVGFFITALNLIPAGQLDGGHLLYAVSPRAHRFATRAMPILLLIFGVCFWTGWALWGILLLIPAMRRHPAVPTQGPLDATRSTLCLLSLAVFALTFTTAPFVGASLLTYLH